MTKRILHVKEFCADGSESDTILLVDQDLLDATNKVLLATTCSNLRKTGAYADCTDDIVVFDAANQVFGEGHWEAADEAFVCFGS